MGSNENNNKKKKRKQRMESWEHDETILIIVRLCFLLVKNLVCVSEEEEVKFDEFLVQVHWTAMRDVCSFQLENISVLFVFSSMKITYNTFSLIIIEKNSFQVIFCKSLS